MLTALLMLVYAKLGKFRHRERILNLGASRRRRDGARRRHGPRPPRHRRRQAADDGAGRRHRHLPEVGICRATRSSARWPTSRPRASARAARSATRTRARSRSPTAASTSWCPTCACTTSTRGPSASERSPRSRASSSPAAGRSSPISSIRVNTRHFCGRVVSASPGACIRWPLSRRSESSLPKSPRVHRFPCPMGQLDPPPRHPQPPARRQLRPRLRAGLRRLLSPAASTALAEFRRCKVALHHTGRAARVDRARAARLLRQAARARRARPGRAARRRLLRADAGGAARARRARADRDDVGLSARRTSACGPRACGWPSACGSRRWPSSSPTPA